jgi:hypothetical protein
MSEEGEGGAKNGVFSSADAEDLFEGELMELFSAKRKDKGPVNNMDIVRLANLMAAEELTSLSELAASLNDAGSLTGEVDGTWPVVPTTTALRKLLCTSGSEHERMKTGIWLVLEKKLNALRHQELDSSGVSSRVTMSTTSSTEQEHFIIQNSDTMYIRKAKNKMRNVWNVCNGKYKAEVQQRLFNTTKSYQYWTHQNFSNNQITLESLKIKMTDPNNCHTLTIADLDACDERRKAAGRVGRGDGAPKPLAVTRSSELQNVKVSPDSLLDAVISGIGTLRLTPDSLPTHSRLTPDSLSTHSRLTPDSLPTHSPTHALAGKKRPSGDSVSASATTIDSASTSSPDDRKTETQKQVGGKRAKNEASENGSESASAAMPESAATSGHSDREKRALARANVKV